MWRIAVPAFGPSLLFGIGEGAILPIVPLTARELGASVPMAALVMALIGIGSLLNNIPASMITMRWGERWAIVAAGAWSAIGMALCVWTSHLGLFALGCFMVGMSQAVYNLARQSYMSEAVPVEYRARALSTLGGVMRIGMFIGPFLAAGAVHFFGLAAAYVLGIVAVAGAALLGARIPDLELPPV
ncbi:MFS transporter, partial [Variovorax paradoxus]|uniref:MFS transporter n=1 Tax=Variovorax paradoxus TaxID=34073 RepID=UPI0039934BAE